jgi:hypothetical protein
MVGVLVGKKVEHLALTSAASMVSKMADSMVAWLDFHLAVETVV